MSQTAEGALIFLGLVVFITIWWSYDRARHPKSHHTACGGTGRRYSRWSSGRWRDCGCRGGVLFRGRKEW